MMDQYLSVVAYQYLSRSMVSPMPRLPFVTAEALALGTMPLDVFADWVEDEGSALGVCSQWADIARHLHASGECDLHSMQIVPAFMASQWQPSILPKSLGEMTTREVDQLAMSPSRHIQLDWHAYIATNDWTRYFCHVVATLAPHRHRLLQTLAQDRFGFLEVTDCLVPTTEMDWGRRSPYIRSVVRLPGTQFDGIPSFGSEYYMHVHQRRYAELTVSTMCDQIAHMVQVLELSRLPPSSL